MKTIKEYVGKQRNTLLPIVKCSHSESTPYMMRLTPFGKYGSTEIIQFMEGFIGTDIYLFSQEMSKRDKLHFHICFYSSREEDSIRDCIRKFLLEKFDGVNNKGDSNKRYNLTEVQEFEQSVVYILKDGGEIFYGSQIDVDNVSSYKKFSYKKYSKEDFASELEDLKKKFKDEDTSVREMMIAIVKLKSTYRQSIRIRNVYEMVISYNIHNDLSRSERFVDDFLSLV